MTAIRAIANTGDMERQALIERRAHLTAEFVFLQVQMRPLRIRADDLREIIASIDAQLEGL